VKNYSSKRAKKGKTAFRTPRYFIGQKVKSLKRLKSKKSGIRDF